MDGRRRGGVTPPDAGARARILDTAAKLFYEEGIQAVGVQRLIDEAGVAKASLYAHFPSKDDVVGAYLAQRGEAWRETVQCQVLDAEAPARDRLLRYFDLVAAQVANPDFRGCPFQHAAAEVRDEGRPARVVADTHRAWLRDVLVRLAREAGARDPGGLAGMLQLLVDGAAAAAGVDGTVRQGADARRAAEVLLDAAIPAASTRRATGTTRARRRRKL